MYPALAQNYRDKLLSLREHNLVGLWPLDELAGTTAYDYSIYGHNGTAANVTVDNASFNNRNSASGFNGTNSVIALPVAALDTPFDPTELTLIIWAKITSTVWGDGGTDAWVELGADANNRTWMFKIGVADSIQFGYNAGGTSKTSNVDVGGTLDWFCVGLTISVTNDRMRCFSSGIQQGADITSLGTWAGALNNAWSAIGDYTGAGGGAPANGNLAYCAVWNTELSHDEMRHIYEWGL
jgi:hypothetical protein